MLDCCQWENSSCHRTKLSTVIYVPSFVCMFPSGEHQRGFPEVVTCRPASLSADQFIRKIKVRMKSIQHWLAGHGSRNIQYKPASTPAPVSTTHSTWSMHSLWDWDHLLKLNWLNKVMCLISRESKMAKCAPWMSHLTSFILRQQGSSHFLFLS